MFKKQHKYFIFLLGIIFLLSAQPVLGLELKYPQLEFGETAYTVSGNSITNFVAYFFVFLVLSAAAIGTLSIVIGGLQILLNFGRPEAINSAKKRIFDTIIGIVLLMSSYIILNTINTDLTNSPSAALVSNGLYIQTNHEDTEGNVVFEYTLLPRDVSDVSQLNLTPDSLLVYYCIGSPSLPTGGPSLMLWVYDLPQFNFTRAGTNGEAPPIAKTLTAGCAGGVHVFNEVDFNVIKSLRWEFKSTGVYYYLDEQCTTIAACQPSEGTSHCVQQNEGHTPSFDSTTGDQVIRCVQVVSSDKVVIEQYGVVLMTSVTQGEEKGCTDPLLKIGTDGNYVMGGTEEYKVDKITINLPGGGLGDKEMDPTYAYIFHPNPYPKTNDKAIELVSERDLSGGEGALGGYYSRYLTSHKSENPDAEIPEKVRGVGTYYKWKSNVGLNPSSRLFLDWNDEYALQPDVKVKDASTLTTGDNELCGKHEALAGQGCLMSIYANGAYNIMVYLEGINDSTTLINPTIIRDKTRTKCYISQGSLSYETMIDFIGRYYWGGIINGINYSSHYDITKVFIIPSTSGGR